jgi:hypothetical protein
LIGKPTDFFEGAHHRVDDASIGMIVEGPQHVIDAPRAGALWSNEPVSATALLPRSSIGGIDRAALGVDLGREHATVGKVCVVRNREELVAAFRWPSIQVQRSTGLNESNALNGAGGTLAQSLKNTLRWRFMLFGMEVHS